MASIGLADSITLRDGRTVSGSYLGGDSRSVRIAVGDRIDTFRVEEISTISFSGDAAVSTPPPRLETRREERRDATRDERRDVTRDERRDATQGVVTLASGTSLTIRTIDSIDSERDYVGKTFHASLDEPVVDSAGNTLIPRGADATVKL